MFSGSQRHREKGTRTKEVCTESGRPRATRVPMKWVAWTSSHSEVSFKARLVEDISRAHTPERPAVMSNNFLHFSFSYSANLSLPISLWRRVLYTSSPTIPSHFHSVHSHSGGPIHWQIRGNEVSSAQFEALLWSWMWNSGSAPLCSSPAGKIRALSLKALYLCSLYGSLLSLNRFGVTFKSQLLRALTVNGHKGWESKRNVSDISFYISLWAGMRTHQRV